MERGWCVPAQGVILNGYKCLNEVDIDGLFACC